MADAYGLWEQAALAPTMRYDQRDLSGLPQIEGMPVVTLPSETSIEAAWRRLGFGQAAYREGAPQVKGVYARLAAGLTSLYRHGFNDGALASGAADEGGFVPIELHGQIGRDDARRIWRVVCLVRYDVERHAFSCHRSMITVKSRVSDEWTGFVGLPLDDKLAMTLRWLLAAQGAWLMHAGQLTHPAFKPVSRESAEAAVSLEGVVAGWSHKTNVVALRWPSKNGALRLECAHRQGIGLLVNELLRLKLTHPSGTPDLSVWGGFSTDASS